MQCRCDYICYNVYTVGDIGVDIYSINSSAQMDIPIGAIFAWVRGMFVGL